MIDTNDNATDQQHTDVATTQPETAQDDLTSEKNDKTPNDTTHYETAKQVLQQMAEQKQFASTVVGVPQENLDYGKIVTDDNNDAFHKTIKEQVEANEEKKRIHKDYLLKAVKWFLGGQFILFFLLLSSVIVLIEVCHCIGNDFSINIINATFDMLKAYMASIIVELLSMLYFIVKNVFDTTIPDLAKIIYGKSNKNEDNEGNDEKGH